MTERKEFKSAEHFRVVLLSQLKTMGQNEVNKIQRIQKQVAFDRFLCRLFIGKSVPWVLKGGHAMELRLQNSRATKDIDIALKDSHLFDDHLTGDANNAILERLRENASIDLQDYFRFTIHNPILDLDAAPYGGGRFPVESFIGAKRFIRFHLDVGIGDVWIEPHDEIELRDWLKFAGIASAKILVINIEQHFSEKIHAYTLPREGEFNSRVKDLVDLVLLIREGKLDRTLLLKALKETFKRRGTHALSQVLNSPPKEWGLPFQALGRECNLEEDLNDAFRKVKSFWETLWDQLEED